MKRLYESDLSLFADRHGFPIEKGDYVILPFGTPDMPRYPVQVLNRGFQTFTNRTYVYVAYDKRYPCSEVEREMSDLKKKGGR